MSRVMYESFLEVVARWWRGRVVGVDRSEALLRDARLRDPPSVDVVCSDFRRVGLRSGSMSLVLIHNMLEHLPAPDRVHLLDEAGRLLVRGGVVAVLEPVREDGYEAGVRGAMERIEAALDSRSGRRAEVLMSESACLGAFEESERLRLLHHRLLPDERRMTRSSLGDWAKHARSRCEGLFDEDGVALAAAVDELERRFDELAPTYPRLLAAVLRAS